jgi:hypothetical protein
MSAALSPPNAFKFLDHLGAIGAESGRETFHPSICSLFESTVLHPRDYLLETRNALESSTFRDSQGSASSHVHYQEGLHSHVTVL